MQNSKPATETKTATEHDIVDRYLATWNERDDARRLALVAQTFAPAARYVDPLAAGQGHAEINAMIRAIQGQFPGLAFSRTGTPDRHAKYLRFSWTLGPAGAKDAKPVAGGTDFAVVTDDGRLEAVTGFLDFAPQS